MGTNYIRMMITHAKKDRFKLGKLHSNSGSLKKQKISFAQVMIADIL